MTCVGYRSCVEVQGQYFISWGIFKNCIPEPQSITLYWKRKHGLSTIDQVLADNGPEFKTSLTQTLYIWDTRHPSPDHLFAGIVTPLLQRGKPQYPKVEDLNLRLTEEQERDTHSQPFKCGHHQTASRALVTTLKTSPQRERGLFLFNPWISNMKYTDIILC